MVHLTRLRKGFNLKPLDFDFGPHDPHFQQLQAFHDEQMKQLREMPSLYPRPAGAPSNTYLHSYRVAEDVYTFSVYIGLSERIAANLRWAVLLHDIGKLDVPVEILDKPDKLTEAEYNEMKKHTLHGAKRIRDVPIKHPILKLAGEIAKYHHERDDGKGYMGLQGKDIPYRVRLVQLCDIYDAVSAPRAYRNEKEQLTSYETMKNMLDPHGFLYSSIDQRFALPFCLLKTNMLEADLSTDHHKMLEHYLLDEEPFHDDDFWPSPEDIKKLD